MSVFRKPIVLAGGLKEQIQSVDTLLCPGIANSSLTSTRVTYSGASGLLQDSANLTFDGTTLTSKNFNLPVSTSSVGQILQGTDVILHTTSPSVAASNDNNLFISVGVGAGNYTNTTTNGRNIGIGNQSLACLVDGYFNVCIGRKAGTNITSAGQNVCVGTNAGVNLTTGGNNFCFGANALNFCQAGSANVVIGVNTGLHILGTGNTVIGQSALQATTGDGCIGIGRNAGYYETGSYKLFIDSSTGRTNEAGDRSLALIYGIFGDVQSNQLVAINGHLEPYGLTATRLVYSATGTINAKLVDSANLTFDGTYLKAAGYKSSDGSAGVGGTFTTVDLKTVTVKDGLITSIV